ncbi:MAG: ferredoxin--NADP reductase [Candidatus Nanohaloarchaea archaeon]
MASSPSEDRLRLGIGIVPEEAAGDHSLTPRLLELEEGDQVHIRGPYTYELEPQEPGPEDVVYLSAGIGITPLHSMFLQTVEEGLDSYQGEDRHIWFFQGASWRDELPYHEEMERIAGENENIHYVPASAGKNTSRTGRDRQITYRKSS